MDIVIEDANIIIDLLNIDLYHYCDNLEIEFHSTPFVVREIKNPQQRALLIEMVNSGKIHIDRFEGEELERLDEFISQCEGDNNLTEADCSVLLLAKFKKCRLLTSDQKLRRKAEEEKVLVNGFLWLTDFMVDDGVVTPNDMIGYLTRYLETNHRAPKDEVLKRIKEYQK